MLGPLVSISCITYNHENYIKDTIEGFLMQKTTFPIEILIHDDASTDNTANIIREYEAKFPDIIKPLYETENQWSKGITAGSADFNFPRARGKYIALCEGDDFWTDPFKLQKQVDFLESHEDYGLVHTDIEYVDIFSNSIPPPKGLHEGIRKRVTNGYIFDYYLNNAGFILTVSCMFRRCLLDISAGNQWFVFDHWLFMDIARQSKIYFIPEKTCAYRINPNGLMISNQTFISNRSPYVLLDQLYRFYNKEYPTLEYYLKDPKVEKEIVICYTRLLIMFFKGNLKDLNKIITILKKNLIFIFKIPVCALNMKIRKLLTRK